MELKVRVNEVEHRVEADWHNETLLIVLREHLGLAGTKFSCGIGQCGACVVHVDGAPINSCLVAIKDVANKGVLTIEGLAGDENVPQCGFCQSGQIMQALALVSDTPDPTDADIDRAMSGNLCRCGTYDRIRKSIKKAALAMRGASQ